MAEENYPPLRILPSALAETAGAEPFVVIVRSPEELSRWLGVSLPGLQWLQVEGMLGDSDAWMEAAHSDSEISFDLILANPALEFSDLYKAADTSALRDVRVTVHARPGLIKALRLAAALRLPVRILPGQPSADILAELKEALDFYLHEPAVEAPVEFFHSLLAGSQGVDSGSLWMILEEDPAAFLQYDSEGGILLPRAGGFGSAGSLPTEFVEDLLKSLLAEGAECTTCPWQQSCRGYFKWPDRSYSCEGIKELFSGIEAAADEMARDVASLASQIANPT